MCVCGGGHSIHNSFTLMLHSLPPSLSPFLSFSLSLSVFFSLSASLSLSISLSLCLFHCISLRNPAFPFYVCFYRSFTFRLSVFSVSIRLDQCLSLTVCFSVFMAFCFFLNLSLSLSLSVSVSVSVYVCLSVCLPVSLSFSLSSYLSLSYDSSIQLNRYNTIYFIMLTRDQGQFNICSAQGTQNSNVYPRPDPINTSP